MKAPNEPSWVAVPMFIPLIRQTATAQHAAASPSVPVSTAAVTLAGWRASPAVRSMRSGNTMVPSSK